MKIKSVLLASLIAGASVAAYALDIGAVNEKIKGLLEPFNTDKSKAEMSFQALDANDKNVTHFSAKASIWMKNQLEAALSMPQLEYSYPTPESRPELKLRLNLMAKFAESLGVEFLDEVADGAADVVKSFAEDFTRDYGKAATVDAQVSQLDKDENGHVTNLKLHIDLKIDLSQLPEKMPVSQVELEDMRIEFSADREKAELYGIAHLNKNYFGFQNDQRGLKEIIEGLLNDDSSTYQDMRSYVDLASQLLDYLTKEHKKKEN